MTKTIHITFITAIAIIITALIIEWNGYSPCALCLKGRYIWWSLIALCPVLYILPLRYQKMAFGIIIIGLIANSMLSIYHMGGEWNWWSLAATCSSASVLPTLDNLFTAPQLCNEASLRIFGISLAGYNAIISVASIVFIGYKIRHAR